MMRKTIIIVMAISVGYVYGAEAEHSSKLNKIKFTKLNDSYSSWLGVGSGVALGGLAFGVNTLAKSSSGVTYATTLASILLGSGIFYKLSQQYISHHSTLFQGHITEHNNLSDRLKDSKKWPTHKLNWNAYGEFFIESSQKEAKKPQDDGSLNSFQGMLILPPTASYQITKIGNEQSQVLNSWRSLFFIGAKNMKFLKALNKRLEPSFNEKLQEKYRDQLPAQGRLNSVQLDLR